MAQTTDWEQVARYLAGALVRTATTRELGEELGFWDGWPEVPAYKAATALVLEKLAESVHHHDPLMLDAVRLRERCEVTRLRAKARELAPVEG